MTRVQPEPALIRTPPESLVISDQRQSVGSSMSAVGSISCPYTFVCDDTPQKRVGRVETSSTNCGKPWNKSKAMFSDMMLRRIASDIDSSSIYFNCLPYSKRIKLLKQTKTMTHISAEFAESLVSCLKLTPVELKNWLWFRQEKNRKIAQNRDLPAEVIPLLHEEFKLSSCMVEERSLLLSYELDLSPDVIRSWFKSQKKSRRAGLLSENGSFGGAVVVENSVFHSTISCSGNAEILENFSLRRSSSPAEKLIYSSSLSAHIESLKETSFFYNLSPSDQLLLLKRFHELPLQGWVPLADIAAELVSALTSSLERDTTQRLPDIADLVIWIQETRKLYGKLAVADHPTSMVHDEAASFLEDEFSMSNMVSDGRVLMLSYVLALTVNKVRQWFYLRNVKLQEQAVVSLSPATLSSTRVATSCTEAQFIQLMEMFKADGSTSPTNIEKVAGQTELPPSQVGYWFSATQQSLRSFTRNQVLENLAANLSEYIIMELEERYCHSRRISFQQAAASASLLGIDNAKSVLSWFEWRRTYDLLKVNCPSEDIQEPNKRIASILEGRFPKPPGVLINPSKYGICYDDSNRAIFPAWSGPACNPSYVAASAEETRKSTISRAGCASELEPSIESVLEGTSPAPTCKQE